MVKDEASPVTYEELCQVIDEHYRDWNPPLGFDHLRDRHMDVSGPWVPAFLSLLWLTGGRVSEVLALRGRDITTEDIDGVQVAKVSMMNLKQRGRIRNKVVATIIDEYPRLWDHIDKYHDHLIHKDGLMFPRSRKTAWHHANKLFGRGTHSIGRHSWVMNQARRKTPILDVKQMGGWARLNSMDAYLKDFTIEEIKNNQVALFKKQQQH